MTQTVRTRIRRRLMHEPLESRHLLASFGTPWPEPRSLSVSFPSDQAAIGPYENSLRHVFDQVADRAQWQEAALRAFQTWTVYADLNVGLVPDRGDRFGAVGLATNDPRFGEFRIGAFPQPGVLASSVPYQPRAGSWSGDVLLNTQVNYFLADWNSSDPIDVPQPDARGSAVELFSVLLHEAGNALGLPDTDVPGAVMNGTYAGPIGQLESSDIAAIQQLYGPRTDIHESRGNDSAGQATAVEYPPEFDGTQPLAVPGRLNATDDVDYYRVRPLMEHEKLTVRLQAAGISLVKARLEVLDRHGDTIADAKADSVFENNLELEIGSLNDHPELLIRVASNIDDVFGVGDYRLEFDYRPSELRPDIQPAPHDADAEGDDEDSPLDFVSVDALFAEVGLLDLEIGANDALATPVSLETTPGFLPQTRYEVISALASADDRDLWAFQAPDFPSPNLLIHVEPLGTDRPDMEAVLLSQAGDRIAAQATRSADGGVSLVVAEPTPGATYVLFLRTLAGSPISAGNYIATMDMATNPADSVRPVYSASVSPSAEHVSKLIVPKSQLYRLDLVASSRNWSNGVQLSLYDARTGELVRSFAAAAGTTRSEYTWLSAGSYYLRATHRARAGAAGRPVSFTLRADVLSDDQGPQPIDPTLPPEYPVYPDFQWEPVEVMQPPPIMDYLEPPFEDPWNSSFFDPFYEDYYAVQLA